MRKVQRKSHKQKALMHERCEVMSAEMTGKFRNTAYLRFYPCSSESRYRRRRRERIHGEFTNGQIRRGRKYVRTGKQAIR
jgi:hypothetical protein